MRASMRSAVLSRSSAARSYRGASRVSAAQSPTSAPTIVSSSACPGRSNRSSRRSRSMSPRAAVIPDCATGPNGMVTSAPEPGSSAPCGSSSWASQARRASSAVSDQPCTTCGSSATRWASGRSRSSAAWASGPGTCSGMASCTTSSITPGTAARTSGSTATCSVTPRSSSGRCVASSTRAPAVASTASRPARAATRRLRVVRMGSFPFRSDPVERTDPGRRFPGLSAPTGAAAAPGGHRGTVLRVRRGRYGGPVPGRTGRGQEGPGLTSP